MFNEVMERLEAEARALKEGKKSRVDWRILTILYCIKVGNYENLLLLLLDLSRRLSKGGTFSRRLLDELASDLPRYLKNLTVGELAFLKREMETLSNAIIPYDHWWWDELTSVLA